MQSAGCKGSMRTSVYRLRRRKTFGRMTKPGVNFVVESRSKLKKGNAMKPTMALILLALVSACTSTMSTEQEIEATRDFVAANQLNQVDSIRLFEQLDYRVVNDYFVTVETRRGDYLLEFRTRCRELTMREFYPHMVDRRSDPNRIRARLDTIRGCQISKMYEVSEAQREELHRLGDAPGDEIFLPDEEEEESSAEPTDTDD